MSGINSWRRRNEEREVTSVQIALQEKTVGGSQAGLEACEGLWMRKEVRTFIKNRRESRGITGEKEHKGSPLKPTGVSQVWLWSCTHTIRGTYSACTQHTVWLHIEGHKYMSELS